MAKIRVGVVGIGYLGSIHARKYSEISGCVLAGACDTDKQKCKSLEKELNIPVFSG